MDKVFKALANRTRRRMLDRLLEAPGLSLNDLCLGCDIRRQTVTRHIQVLIDGGLIHIEWRGRERLHYLNPVPIAEIGQRWIDKYSRARADAILNLKAALEEKQERKRDE